MSQKQSLIIPLITLENITVFPNMTASFSLKTKNFSALLTTLDYTEKTVFLMTQAEENKSYKIGTIANIETITKLSDDVVLVISHGKQRASLKSTKIQNDVEYAKVLPLYDDDFLFQIDLNDSYVTALMKLAFKNYEQYLQYIPNGPASEILKDAKETNHPGILADYMIAGLTASSTEKQKILEELNPLERLEKTLELLKMEYHIFQIQQSIEMKTKEKINENQKEYYLKQKLKAIQDELGISEAESSVEAEFDDFIERLIQKAPPEHIENLFEKELGRLKMMSPFSSDANIIRTFLDTILSLPFQEMATEEINLKTIEKTLQENHYGLQKVKERILEYLAMELYVKKQSSNILCLVGPPGVGKTSIVKSVATALQRKFVRVSLGGVNDEAEIRGHRRTYIGAMPGRIIKAMQEAEIINPIILLDEIDKIGTSHKGNPASALLEILDFEQNQNFRDHYIEVSYDLSHVLFICTANDVSTIPKPLLDRMELIELHSYTENEKIHIAQKHLLPAQKKLYDVPTNLISFHKSALPFLIQGYTKEAGVRTLSRLLDSLYAKALRSYFHANDIQKEKDVEKLKEKELFDIEHNISNKNSTLQKKHTIITTKKIEELLGKRKYLPEEKFSAPQVGIVRGLAWTAVGGTTLSIEVNISAGDGKFNFTGNIGKVMEESASVSLAYIRSQSHRLNLPEDFYKTNDIHIHIPQGATPKDGPSAGITMTTAILSALTNAKIRPDVAMTGEMTIRGQVLPIGGLKEKVIAAKTLGITHVLLPYQNEKDLSEIEAEIKKDMSFTLVKTIDDVLPIVLAKGEVFRYQKH